jgi:hypothetical protein
MALLYAPRARSISLAPFTTRSSECPFPVLYLFVEGVKFPYDAEKILANVK